MAGRALSPGEMLTISYGNLTNSELLLDYGFTLPDNPHDRFDFSLSDDLIRASQRLMAFDTEAFGDKRVPVRPPHTHNQAGRQARERGREPG